MLPIQVAAVRRGRRWNRSPLQAGAMPAAGDPPQQYSYSFGDLDATLDDCETAHFLDPKLKLHLCNCRGSTLHACCSTKRDCVLADNGTTCECDPSHFRDP
jgi:hypothetical protein